VLGLNRARTADCAAAAAADTRCAQAKRDRSNSSPPPPSQWSPWSRVLQRTPILCPVGRRNGSSHATLSSTVSRCGVFGKFTAPPEEGSAWPHGHGRKGNSLHIYDKYFSFRPLNNFQRVPARSVLHNIL